MCSISCWTTIVCVEICLGVLHDGWECEDPAAVGISAVRWDQQKFRENLFLDWSLFFTIEAEFTNILQARRKRPVTAEYGKYGLFDSTDDLRKSKRMRHMLHLWNRLYHETLQFLVKWNQKTSNNKLHRKVSHPPFPQQQGLPGHARLLHRPARVYSIQDPLLKWPETFPRQIPASSATATVAFSTACWGKFLEKTKKPGTMETPATAGSVSCSSCIFVRAKLNYFSMIFHPSVKRILTKACNRLLTNSWTPSSTPFFSPLAWQVCHLIAVTFYHTIPMLTLSNSSPTSFVLPHDSQQRTGIMTLLAGVISALMSLISSFCQKLRIHEGYIFTEMRNRFCRLEPDFLALQHWSGFTPSRCW